MISAATTQSPPTAAKKRAPRPVSGGGDARVQKSKTSEDVEQRCDDIDGVHASTAAVAAEPVRRSQRAAAADAAKNISNFLSGDLSGLRIASPPYPPRIILIHHPPLQPRPIMQHSWLTPSSCNQVVTGKAQSVPSRITTITSAIAAALVTRHQIDRGLPAAALATSSLPTCCRQLQLCKNTRCMFSKTSSGAHFSACARGSDALAPALTCPVQLEHGNTFLPSVILCCRQSCCSSAD